MNSSTGWTTSPGIVALVDVEPALEHDDRPAGQAPEQQPPDVARARSPPASRAAPRTGSRPDPRRRRRARPAPTRARSRPPARVPVRAADGGLERRRAGRAGPAGGIGRVRIDRASLDGHAGLQERVQGEDGRGPRLRPPGGVPTPGCRSRPAGRSPVVPAGAGGRGQRSARSDRSRSEALDVISVSPVSVGPFGQELRYGAAVGRVNGLIHELRCGRRQRIHEFSTVVDDLWISRWTDDRRRMAAWAERPEPRLRGPQPPIANISTRGRSAVASVRSSE